MARVQDLAMRAEREVAGEGPAAPVAAANCGEPSMSD